MQINIFLLKFNIKANGQAIRLLKKEADLLRVSLLKY